MLFNDFTNWIKQSTLSTTDESLFLPNGKLLEMASLGNGESFADLYWIKSRIYFSDRLQKDTRYTYLYDLLDLVTDLDPLFFRAYNWGASTFLFNTSSITLEDRLNSTKLWEKAHRNIKNDWRVPYFLSFNYFFELGEYEKAAALSADMLKFPDLPLRIKHWVTHVNAKAENKEETGFLTAKVMLEEYLLLSPSKKVSDILKKRLTKFQEEEHVDQKMNLLKSFAHYYRKHEFSFVPFTMFVLLQDRMEDAAVDFSFREAFPLIDHKIQLASFTENKFQVLEREVHRE